jgi:hypothetical protein
MAYSADEVPVTRVSLFSSGVGFFEHSGKVSGDASTTLRFNADQINDVLKSLVLQDLDGGSVGTISYPSQDPLGRTLRGFRVDLSQSPSVAALMTQLRGAKVKIDVGGSSVEGSVLGVETRKRPAGENVIDAAVINVVGATGIRSIFIDDIASLTLDDPRLQEELTKALVALAQSRDQDKKDVTIALNGQGDRRVRIGYVVETPVWKTSYRLVMPAPGQDKPMLQGWALVENQTDSDWNSVQLSLVSGRPTSFKMDLYTPLYLDRPEAQLDLFAGLRPQVYEGGMNQLAGGARLEEESVGRRMPRLRAAAPASAVMDKAEDSFFNVTNSVAATASVGQIGELFEYVVPGVTIARQSSAMIPIINDPVQVRPLSIYNANVHATHPLTGARITNTTGKHLLQGPITVFAGGSYAGDAQINNVPPGQDRLISYGIDLQTVVDGGKVEQFSHVLSGKILKGVLEVTNKVEHIQTYSIQNKSQQKRDVLIVHPRFGGWDLVGSLKPVETTDALYRFETAVDAGKTESLQIKQEQIATQTVALLPMNVDQLLFFVNTGRMPQAVRDSLVKAIDLKRTLAGFERAIDESQGQIESITEEQNRIRQNMQTVDRNSAYYNRLMTKLNEQESKIETLQTQIDKDTESLEKTRTELETYLSSLDVG